MAIYRLLKNRAFGPDEIKVLTTAYEDALRVLRLTNRSDRATEIIAKKSSSLPSAASAIRSDCANARSKVCRNSPGIAAFVAMHKKAPPLEPCI
jgi:hypothetical protein